MYYTVYDGSVLCQMAGRVHAGGAEVFHLMLLRCSIVGELMQAHATWNVATSAVLISHHARKHGNVFFSTLIEKLSFLPCSSPKGHQPTSSAPRSSKCSNNPKWERTKQTSVFSLIALKSNQPPSPSFMVSAPSQLSVLLLIINSGAQYSPKC